MNSDLLQRLDSVSNFLQTSPIKKIKKRSRRAVRSGCRGSRRRRRFGRPAGRRSGSPDRFPSKARAKNGLGSNSTNPPTEPLGRRRDGNRDLISPLCFSPRVFIPLRFRGNVTSRRQQETKPSRGAGSSEEVAAWAPRGPHWTHERRWPPPVLEATPPPAPPAPPKPPKQRG